MTLASVRYRIHHVTRYVYSEGVSLCHNLAKLTPRQVPGQTVHHSLLTISPSPAIRTDHLDSFRNPCTNVTIQEPHRELILTAAHEITVSTAGTPTRKDAWERVRDQLQTDRSADWLDATEFHFESPMIPTSPRYATYAAESFRPGRGVLEAAFDLTQRIHRDFKYDPRATNVTTTVAELFEQRRGVCQDFAHFQIACLRSLGLAARYVSGYLSTTPPPGRPRLIGADATHAWVSVFCGADGWVAMDPTNSTLANERHIVLAWGRDYSDVCPVKGVILGGGNHRVEVSVDAAEVE
jgi:transglutaminase-like putative cysteine protease